MALVTRNVNNTGSPLYGPSGVLLANTTITFTLVDFNDTPTGAFDATTGDHVIGSVSVVTNASGEFSVGLWPNTRGDRTTKYVCAIKHPNAEVFVSIVPAGAAPLSWLDFKLAGAVLTPIQVTALDAHIADLTAHGGGDVVGPASATEGNFPSLSATGKVLSDSGYGPRDFLGLAIDYFMVATVSSDIVGYSRLSEDPSTGAETNFTTVVTGTGVLLRALATEAGFPGITTIVAGVHNIHIHAAKTAGVAGAFVYAAVYKRSVAGVETLLATTINSPLLTASNVEIDLHFTLPPPDTALLITDRLVIKLFATKSGVGTNPTVAIYFEGLNASRIDIKSTTDVLDSRFMTKNVYDVDNDGVVDEAERLGVIARNNTGSTILTGPAVGWVYISGAIGQNPTVALANAATEITSNSTIGVVYPTSIANNATGRVITKGRIHGVDTSAFTDGAVLWLSDTVPGGAATARPTAPSHGVFLGWVAYAHAVNGVFIVDVQNGSELEEQHDVRITTPAAGEMLRRRADNLVWENAPGRGQASGVASLGADSKLVAAEFPALFKSSNFVPGFTTTVTSATPITLTVSSTHFQDLTGTAAQTIVLPVVSTLTTGHSFYFDNDSTATATVNSSGGNLVLSIPAGSFALIVCVLNTGTTAASWSSRIAAKINGDTTQAFSASGVTTSGTGTGLTVSNSNSTTAQQESIAGTMTFNTAAIAALSLTTGMTGGASTTSARGLFINQTYTPTANATIQSIYNQFTLNSGVSPSAVQNMNTTFILGASALGGTISSGYGEVVSFTPNASATTNITNWYSFATTNIANGAAQTVGTATGFYSGMASVGGSTRWGFYAAGTADNAFNGNCRFGGVTAPTVAVDVTGAIAATTTIKTGGYTVATLPAGTTGTRAYVTDATAPTWLGALTGGGAVVCPVFKNATVWVSA